ncbi:MAG: FAD-binding oxidoreductase [Anaerolineae bacterium]|nr:FAD-binding oxidoreductase [Anaerolineae bacterium]
MKSFEKADVVICGAGSAGGAAAYYLAKSGINNVLIIDKNPPLSQTSAKSGENYRNWWPNNTMAHFMDRSIDLMQDLARATDNAFNMEQRGYLYITRKPAHELQSYIDHYSQLDVGGIRVHDDGKVRGAEHYAHPASRGYEGDLDGADLLADSQIIQKSFPHLSANIETAVHARRAGSISAQQLGMYLLEEARKLGVRLLVGDVTDVEVDNQGVYAVEIVIDGTQHRIQTRSFINAAGPFSPEIASLLGVELPVFSVLQQKIAIQDIHGVIPREAPFTIIMDEQYLDWDEQEKADLGSDTELQWLLKKFPGGLHIKPEGGKDSPWIKLGWAINRVAEDPVWEPEMTPEFPEIVLRGAAKFIPGLRPYLEKLPKPVVRYAGYYTKTKENMPIIGPMGVDGAYMLGALSGFGTMASCAAGELVAAWIAGNDLPGYARELSLERYDSTTSTETSTGLNHNGEL